jgi:WD40 repeat protein
MNMEDLTGKQFGPYTFLEPIGEGGMGSVYKSFQVNMNRPVAIKTLPRQLAEDPNFAGRFRQEAVLLASLQHPHILPVFDFGECEGYAYLVMPYIKSGTLKDLMKDSPLPLQKIRTLITQIGGALDYAHSHGLIHRDVKPGNVLIDESGNCLLMDFGLAKMFESSQEYTATGGILGTPAYMSPEQGRGEKADRRSDIYALGVVLYEMATGQLPYNAESAISIIYQHIHDPLPLPSRLNPQLPTAVEKVILKAMAKEPESRYPTAGDMVRALQQAIPENLAEQSGKAEAPAPLERVPGAWKNLSPLVKGILVAGVVLVLALTALALLNRGRGEPLSGGDNPLATSTALEEPVVVVLDATRTLAVERPTATTVAQETAAPSSPAIQTDTSDNQVQESRVTLVIQAPVNTPIAPSPLALTTENAAGARQVGTFNQPHGRVVQWSPDGKYLVVGAYGVFLYNAETLELAREIGDYQWVYHLAFSPDGKTLAVVYDGVTFWNVESGGEIGSIQGLKDAGAIAFSPDGKQLAVSIGMVTKIVDVSSGSELATLTTGPTQSNLVFSPDGQYLVVAGGSASQEIQIIDRKTGKAALGLKETNPVKFIAYSADGQRLATTYFDGNVKIWNASTGLLERNITGHTGQVDGAAFSPDGKLLVSVSWDLTVRIWDVASGQERNVMSGHTGWIQSVSFSPDGARIASCGEDEVVRVWGLPGAASTGGAAAPTPLPAVGSGSIPTALTPAENAIRAENIGQIKQFGIWNKQTAKQFAFSPDGKQIALASYGIFFLAVPSLEEISHIDSVQWVDWVAYSPDGRQLASVSYDGLILWNVDGGGQQKIFEGSKGSKSIAYAPDGSILATITGMAIKLWDPNSGQELRTLPVGSSQSALVFSPDGKLLASSSGVAGQEITVWDTATWQVKYTLKGHSNWIRPLAFSPDAQRLASGSVDHSIRVWNMQSGLVERKIDREAMNGINGLSFTPDGLLIASANDDLLVHIWNLADGSELATLSGATQNLNFIAFSPDGAYLAAGAEALRLYRIGE